MPELSLLEEYKVDEDTKVSEEELLNNKNKIVEKECYNIQSFSLFKNKEQIIEEVKKIHSDECPIIVFIKIEGNDDFLEWVKNSVD